MFVNERLKKTTAFLFSFEALFFSLFFLAAYFGNVNVSTIKKRLK